MRETPEERDARMAWWREARFGMFIHWGPDAIPSLHWEGEPWNDPDDPIIWFPAHESILNIPPESWRERVIKKFNPVHYDADAWVRLAKRAGMKYIVITVKHHNGFCMWPGLPGYDITVTPFDRDPIAELVEACRRHDMRIGFYFSQLDWHDPDAVGDHSPRTYPQGWIVNPDEYLPRMRAQLRDLLTRYGHIDLLWFDGEWIEDWTLEMGQALEAELREIQPHLIINDRIGKRTPTCGDYGTPEQFIPPNGLPGVDWETCMTMNNTWFYVEQDQNWKDTRTLLHMLIDCASKGGNFLLNIGPRADGTIPEASIERLLEMGHWLETNGQSIYGTSASPFSRHPAWGRFTQKQLDDGNTQLYLHIFEWPLDSVLRVPAIENDVLSAHMLSVPDRPKLAVNRDPDTNELLITLSNAERNDYAGVVVLKVEGEVAADVRVIGADDQGALTLEAGQAEIRGVQMRFDPQHESLGSWTNIHDYAKWRVRADQPGRYHVDVTYGCAADGGGTYAIEIGDSRITAESKVSGGWFERRTDTIGELAITEAGQQELRVRLVESPGTAVFDLQRIVLRPVE